MSYCLCEIGRYYQKSWECKILKTLIENEKEPHFEVFETKEEAFKNLEENEVLVRGVFPEIKGRIYRRVYLKENK